MYKIVIADDDIGHVNELSQLIEQSAYEMKIVACFSSGVEVIEYIQKNSVDAVITDITMPRISGIDIARFIYEEYPGIKVLLFDVQKNFEYAQTAIEYGALGYMTKPVSPSELNKYLQKLYKELSEEGPTGFFGDETIRRRSEFIVDYFASTDVHDTVIKDAIERVPLPISFMNRKCAFATLELCDFDDYSENIWRHEKDTLYDALRRIVCYEDGNCYCIPISILDNEMTVIINSKKSDVSKVGCITEIRTRLYEAFCITVREIGAEQADTLAQMKRFIKSQNSEYCAKLNKILELEKQKNVDRIEADGYIQVVKDYIDRNYYKEITLDEVASQVYMRGSVLSRFFKANLGEKFIDYLNRVRIEKAKVIITTEEENVKGLHKRVGYRSESYFYKIFRFYTGMTPIEYRRRHIKTGK